MTKIITKEEEEEVTMIEAVVEDKDVADITTQVLFEKTTSKFVNLRKRPRNRLKRDPLPRMRLRRSSSF